MSTDLRVGSNFWAIRRVGYYLLSGDPMDFTIIGETKTLWRVKRTSCSMEEVKPFTVNKDMSEWGVISAEDAEKIKWVRANARDVAVAVGKLTTFGAENEIKNYAVLKLIADLVAEADTVKAAR